MPSFVYFINGTSLSDSTAVFLDSDHLICAPNGYYSDGVVIRQQIGCVLLGAISCPSCLAKCGEDVISSNGDVGYYSLAIDVGTTLGAVIIRFNPGSNPEGIIAERNGFYYNELSSPIFGRLVGTANQPTFIGNVTFQGSCPAGSIVGGPYTLDKFKWNGTSFITDPGTESITVAVGNTDLTGGDPGDCIMVIPKTTATSSVVNVSIYGVCTNALFDVTIECPALLPSFKGSKQFFLIGPTYCEAPVLDDYYVAKVNNFNPYPYLELYDWVFQDPYGQTKLIDGYYKTYNLFGAFDTILVSNGVIVNISSQCP